MLSAIADYLREKAQAEKKARRKGFG